MRAGRCARRLPPASTSTARSRLPIRSTEALALAKARQGRGLKHGVVQDKLFLPGLRKLKRLIDSGFFGRILSVRGEFGYWVFEGDWQPAQRPSWNYRKEDGGGIILDMFCHWRYVLDHTFGAVKRGQLPRRHAHSRAASMRKASPTRCDADDTAYATFELDGGIVAQINSSWYVARAPRRTLQHAGGRNPWLAPSPACASAGRQHRVNTPRPVWNPDIRQSDQFLSTMGARCPTTALRQRVQGSVGDVPPSRCSKTHPSRMTCSKAQGRAAGRTRTQALARAPLARRAGTEDLGALADHSRFRWRQTSSRPTPARAARATAAISGWPVSNAIAYAAAHVVVDPIADLGPWLDATIDWERQSPTVQYLWSLGLGVAEAMDTAQRGMGFDWPTALELIRAHARSSEARPAR